MSSRTLAATARLVSNAPIPLVGLGTWRSATNEVEVAVRAAIEVGYRHIDCAAIYENEHKVGEVFKELVVPRRSDFFVTSKLWNNKHRPELVRGACVKTLSDLQLDYLDLYLIHWPVSQVPGGKALEDVPLLDTWREMEKLVDDKLVRHIGVSNFSKRHLEQIIPHARVPIAVNQVELHPYLPQEELVAYCHSHNIHMTAYSPLGSGLEPRLLNDPVLNAIAKEVSRTPAQVALRWGMLRGTSVIPKSVKPARVRENAELDFELSEDQIKRINALGVTKKRYVPGFWPGVFDR